MSWGSICVAFGAICFIVHWFLSSYDNNITNGLYLIKDHSESVKNGIAITELAKHFVNKTWKFCEVHFFFDNKKYIFFASDKSYSQIKEFINSLKVSDKCIASPLIITAQVISFEGSIRDVTDIFHALGGPDTDFFDGTDFMFKTEYYKYLFCPGDTVISMNNDFTEHTMTF